MMTATKKTATKKSAKKKSAKKSAPAKTARTKTVSASVIEQLCMLRFAYDDHDEVAGVTAIHRRFVRADGGTVTQNMGGLDSTVSGDELQGLKHLDAALEVLDKLVDEIELIAEARKASHPKAPEEKGEI